MLSLLLKETPLAERVIVEQRCANVWGPQPLTASECRPALASFALKPEHDFSASFRSFLKRCGPMTLPHDIQWGCDPNLRMSVMEDFVQNEHLSRGRQTHMEKTKCV